MFFNHRWLSTLMALGLLLALLPRVQAQAQPDVATPFRDYYN